MIAVIQFPGSNCDRDCVKAFYHIGREAGLVWHKETSLKGFDAIVLPGGFSYGDYLRPGAMASHSPIMKEVVAFAKKGYPVLGICNGFQILIEAGLLPGSLLRNAGLKFVCQEVTVKVEISAAKMGASLIGQTFTMPIAHHDGNFFTNDLEGMRDRGEILLTYSIEDPNPNGSLDRIAGVCNSRGNVVGMMPHPERAYHSSLGSTHGAILLEHFYP